MPEEAVNRRLQLVASPHGEPERNRPQAMDTEEGGGPTWPAKHTRQDDLRPSHDPTCRRRGDARARGCSGAGGPREREPEPAGPQRSAREREWCRGCARNERKLRDVRLADVSAADSAPRQPERRECSSRSVLEHPGRVTVVERERQRTGRRQAVRGVRRQGRQQEPTGTVPRRLRPQRGLRVRHELRNRTNQPGAHRLRVRPAVAASDPRDTAGRGDASGSREPPAELVSAVSLPSVSVPSVGLPAVAGGALPVTGGGVLILVLVALGAIAAGGGMTVIARHRLTKA
jgi:hypothetical protein